MFGTEPIPSSTTLNVDNLWCKSNLNSTYDKSLIQKNLKLAWVGDFQSVKCLTADYLKLDGKWDSPGGEKKVLYCGDSPTILWWSKKKLLQFEGANAEFIQQRLLLDFCSENHTDLVRADINKVQSDFESIKSTCNELSVDLEGMKLDMTIAESKQERAIDQVREDVNKIQNDFNSINSMIHNLAHDKVVLNTYDAEIIDGLRDENRVLSDTLEVLTVELAKHKSAINSPKSIIDNATSYANSPVLPTIGINQPVNQMEAQTNENVDEVVTTRKNLQVTTVSPTFDEQMLEYKQAQKNRLRANLSRNTSLYCDIQNREYTQNRIRKESLKKSTKAKRNFHIVTLKKRPPKSKNHPKNGRHFWNYGHTQHQKRKKDILSQSAQQQTNQEWSQYLTLVRSLLG